MKQKFYILTKQFTFMFDVLLVMWVDQVMSFLRFPVYLYDATLLGGNATGAVRNSASGRWRQSVVRMCSAYTSGVGH